MLPPSNLLLPAWGCRADRSEGAPESPTGQRACGQASERTFLEKSDILSLRSPTLSGDVVEPP
ncbi:hypothetical protein Q664_44220 [Archangium violaceum Cb vi76]|uniref:Uncharacterized protein n=1 Tax=Archangium violaceum Cb vi76 TaxID=1406225 RepID=A0A084SHN4_9BACT|nr:hypothetical protein Q664_44220 [Archangium violaceum Cb vi76]